MMSEDGDGENEGCSLDYDMWEGQFEFVGPDEMVCSPHGLLKPPPHLPANVNGSRKNAAHVWCDEVNDKVISTIFIYPSSEKLLSYK